MPGAWSSLGLGRPRPRHLTSPHTGRPERRNAPPERGSTRRGLEPSPCTITQGCPNIGPKTLFQDLRFIRLWLSYPAQLCVCAQPGSAVLGLSRRVEWSNASRPHAGPRAEGPGARYRRYQLPIDAEGLVIRAGPARDQVGGWRLGLAGLAAGRTRAEHFICRPLTRTLSGRQVGTRHGRTHRGREARDEPMDSPRSPCPCSPCKRGPRGGQLRRQRGAPGG